MKVIFLDFDGPLSNFRVTLGYGDDSHMDPVAMHALNNICEASGAKIVCTSVRAVLRPGRFEECMWRFQQAGLDISHIHQDWSCNTDNGGNRYEQIEAWLAAHPEVAHYVILDDEGVRNRQGKNHPKLVKTSMYDGIGMSQFRKLARLLDFDLLGAFHKAREGKWGMGQLSLPFQTHDAEHNAQLVIRKLSEEESQNGLWQKFEATVLRRELQDEGIMLRFVFERSGQKGKLFAALHNLRTDADRNIYIKVDGHALIVPKVK